MGLIEARRVCKAAAMAAEQETVVEANEIVTARPATGQLATWTQEQTAIVRTYLMRGKGTEAEFELFRQVCMESGLSPFMRQIWAVFRRDETEGRDVMTIQTGIDGLRAIAARTGRYRGQAGAAWCGPDGRWVDVWTKSEPPFAARCGVMMDGFAEPLYRVARWDEFVQTFYDRQSKSRKLTPLWHSKGTIMLLKCAEAQALRAAAPFVTTVYIEEEMPPEGGSSGAPAAQAAGDGEAARATRSLEDIESLSRSVAAPATAADHVVQGVVTYAALRHGGRGDYVVARIRPIAGGELVTVMTRETAFLPALEASMDLKAECEFFSESITTSGSHGPERKLRLLWMALQKPQEQAGGTVIDAEEVAPDALAAEPAAPAALPQMIGEAEFKVSRGTSSARPGASASRDGDPS